MSSRSWIALLLGCAPGTAGSSSRRRRPRSATPNRLRLEALEERTLLSAGDLDPNFGEGGLVTTPPPAAYNLAAYRVAVQADGRILTASIQTYFKGIPTIELIRYETDGRLDLSFGSNGVVGVPGSGSSARTVGLALQSDGGILVTLGTSGLGVSRLTPDGRLDASFGTSGTASIAFPGYPSAHPSIVVVQPDGAILLGGFASDSSRSSFALARFTANGRLDTSFGNQGGVVTPFPDQTSAAPTGLTLQPDGSIVVAGQIYTTPYRFALARYDHDGHLDPSFGTDGLVATPLPGFSNAFAGRDVAVQTDGRILLAGWVANATGGTHFALARYTSDGSLDGSFGSDGLLTTAFPGFPQAQALDMGLQPDGRILVAGGAYANDGSEQFALARYDSDGNLDDSFGTGGLVTTSFSGIRYVEAAAVTVQPNGRIVAAGYAGAGNGVARYQGDAPVTTHLEVSPPFEVTAGQPFDVTVRAVDDNGNVVPDYTGTITLTSTDPRAPVLGSHTFTTTDGGMYTFSAVQLFTAGPQSLFADDGYRTGEADLAVDPGLAVALVLRGPDQATAGQAFVVTLTAYDAYGNVATGYRGSVSFVSTDPAAQLPVDYAFSSADAGRHDFTITLNSPGPVRLTAIDTYALTLSYLDLTVS
jgi:uncharacterized delta-60 repeat protein